MVNNAATYLSISIQNIFYPQIGYTRKHATTMQWKLEFRFDAELFHVFRIEKGYQKRIALHHQLRCRSILLFIIIFHLQRPGTSTHRVREHRYPIPQCKR